MSLLGESREWSRLWARALAGLLAAALAFLGTVPLSSSLGLERLGLADNCEAADPGPDAPATEPQEGMASGSHAVDPLEGDGESEREAGSGQPMLASVGRSFPPSGRGAGMRGAAGVNAADGVRTGIERPPRP